MMELRLFLDWFLARSRMPRTWIHKLNQRRSAAGLLVKATLRAYSHAACAEEAKLLAGTESPVSPLTRRVYEHLKAGRARPDSVDYLPKQNDAKTNKWNPDYSSLYSLRRLAKEDKLGPRSSSPTKASSTNF